jgi:tetratricopeptide (TPR) repeat protein
MCAKQVTLMAPEVIAALDRGVATWRAGRLSEAETAFRSALERASAQCCVSGIVSARSLLGSLAYAQGAFGEAQAQHEAVLEQCRAVGLRLGIASALHNLGLVAAIRGDAAAGVRLIERAIRLYEALGETSSAARARSNRAALVAGQAENAECRW